MGKRDVRVIRVPRIVSGMLLLLATAGILALVYLLSGRAYASETHSTRDLLMRIFREGEAGELTSNRALAALMPVVADMLPFVPWGFLAFIVFDRPGRSRFRTYFITIIACLMFAAAIEIWQDFLPTRITTLSDSAATAAGALLGAILGHVRKSVRVAFQV